MSSLPLDDRALLELEQKFDPEMRFRPLLLPAVTVVGALLILLSAFHYYTAGFGLLQEVTHRGVHLAFVLGLIFLVFPHHRALLTAAPRHRLASPGGVPWFDWLLAGGIAASAPIIDLPSPGTMSTPLSFIVRWRWPRPSCRRARSSRRSTAPAPANALPNSRPTAPA